MDITGQYNTIGEAYLKGQTAFFSKREDWARTFIRENLGALKGKDLLDVGCGHGPDLAYYEENGARVWGIDVSEYLVNCTPPAYT